MVSVLLADAQYLIRMGLKNVIANRPDIEVVGEAATKNAMFSKVALHQPNVLIMDYHDSDAFSPEDILLIRQTAPNTKVLIISSDNDKGTIFKVIETGINGFLTKFCDRGEIISAIYATAKGERFFCNKIVNLLLEKHIRQSDAENCSPANLTVRETEIVQLIAEGIATKEISEQLHLSTHTIYTHRRNIMKKLGVNSASELILYAIKTGIVQTG